MEATEAEAMVESTITLATRGKRRATLSTTTVATEATIAEVTGLAAAIEAATTATEAAEVVDESAIASVHPRWRDRELAR